MPLADEERIKTLVRELDEAVPRRGKLVVLDEADEGGTIVRADQLGYLRLGIEFLKAAHSAQRSEVLPHEVELDLGYLAGLQRHCYSFERREDADVSPTPADTSGGTFAGLLAGAIGLFFVASLLIGAYTILGWLFRPLL